MVLPPMPLLARALRSRPAATNGLTAVDERITVVDADRDVMLCVNRRRYVVNAPSSREANGSYRLWIRPGIEIFDIDPTASRVASDLDLNRRRDIPINSRLCPRAALFNANASPPGKLLGRRATVPPNKSRLSRSRAWCALNGSNVMARGSPAPALPAALADSRGGFVLRSCHAAPICRTPCGSVELAHKHH